jgi:hypothetical protein
MKNKSGGEDNRKAWPGLRSHNSSSQVSLSLHSNFPSLSLRKTSGVLQHVVKHAARLNEFIVGGGRQENKNILKDKTYLKR